jgi:hypothetical protein
LLIIILTPHYNLSGLSSAGNLPIASALTTNDSNNRSSNGPILLNYDNPFLAIKIQFPSNWFVAQHFINGLFIAQFISPIQNTTEKFPASVSISIQPLPKNITTLNEYTNVAYKLLKLIYERGGGRFNITESNNSTTLTGTIPAFEREFTVQQHFLDKTLKIIPVAFKVMKLYGISANKIYVVTFTAETSKYDSYLPVAQKMIDSFKIIPAGQTSNLGAANAGSNNTNHTAATFHSTFDTYILPGSARGYGVYSKPISNQSFLQGDTAELYVELTGFGYRAVTTNQNTTASNGNTTTTATPQGQTDFTANILLFDKQGKELLATQYKVPHMVVPLGQTQYVTIPIQIPKNLPVGQYDVRYFIMDGTSGNNFEMDKHIIIMAPKLQASVS